MADVTIADATVVLPQMPAASPSGGTERLDSTSLGRLLGALASRPGPVPKYRYPSAGTLYPVQAYIVLRRSLNELEAGSYYHDPEAHALVRLSDAIPAAPDGSCPPALLLLAAQSAAIAPIYADHASAFSLLEAGYMFEALADAGSGLVLRDAGDPAGTTDLAAACALDANHVPLACWAVGEDR